MPFPLTPILDDFNRTNESPIVGYTKIAGQGDINLVGNQAVGSGATVVKDSVSLPTNQEAYFSLKTIDSVNSVAIVLRSTGDTYYRIVLINSSPWSVVFQKIISGSGEELSTQATTTPQVNDVFGARIFNGLLRAFLNSMIVGEVSDGAIPSGASIGFEINGSWALDDFGGGIYSETVPHVSNLYSFPVRIH